MWKSVNIPGLEEILECNKSGKVRNIKTKHVYKPNLRPDGYYTIHVRVHGNNRSVQLHKILASTWIFNPDNLSQVNHRNGDKTDCRLQNLEWVSQNQNMNHLYIKLHGTNEKYVLVMASKTKDFKDPIIFSSVKEACLYFKRTSRAIRKAITENTGYKTSGYWFKGYRKSDLISFHLKDKPTPDCLKKIDIEHYIVT